jgi:hypothetical protein
MTQLTIDTIHAELVGNALDGKLSEEDAFMWMVLLHTHEIHLRPGVLADRPAVCCLAALTQRHAASVIAELWPDRKDSQRTEYVYWYVSYCGRMPQVLSALPPEMLPRLFALHDALSADPRVTAVVEEDP